ncbi:hypothetical protein VN96_1844 [Lactococcus cremoris]|uniref:hypothetical protein n=1 Tax=Lactococcus lactis subsp. cremoris TaxID=1359 RepID=UPI00062A3FA3|nr:hypothetical protein [Lactococcus cremoris]KKW71859.1 hypothetical protein VN96_1844 [Lactococcus cremoris]MCT0509774.1 hypothetical protein [Lactococcus cremoris]
MLLEVSTKDGSCIQIPDYEKIRYSTGMSERVFTDDLNDFSIGSAYTYNIKSKDGYLSINGSEITRIQLFND